MIEQIIASQNRQERPQDDHPRFHSPQTEQNEHQPKGGDPVAELRQCQTIGDKCGNGDDHIAPIAAIGRVGPALRFSLPEKSDAEEDSASDCQQDTRPEEHETGTGIMKRSDAQAKRRRQDKNGDQEADDTAYHVPHIHHFL